MSEKKPREFNMTEYCEGNAITGEVRFVKSKQPCIVIEKSAYDSLKGELSDLRQLYYKVVDQRNQAMSVAKNAQDNSADHVNDLLNKEISRKEQLKLKYNELKRDYDCLDKERIDQVKTLLDENARLLEATKSQGPLIQEVKRLRAALKQISTGRFCAACSCPVPKDAKQALEVSGS